MIYVLIKIDSLHPLTAREILQNQVRNNFLVDKLDISNRDWEAKKNKNKKEGIELFTNKHTGTSPQSDTKTMPCGYKDPNKSQ